MKQNFCELCGWINDDSIARLVPIVNGFIVDLSQERRLLFFSTKTSEMDEFEIGRFGTELHAVCTFCLDMIIKQESEKVRT